MKNVDREKLFEFLREMEFNRLLSQAISFYGEALVSNLNEPSPLKKK